MGDAVEQQGPAEGRPESLPPAFADVPALVASLKATQAALTKANQQMPKEAHAAAPTGADAVKSTAVSEVTGADAAVAAADSAEEGELEAPDPELVAKEPEAEIDPANASNEQAQEMLSKKGLNLDDLTNEWQRHGDLTPESYQRLEAAGISKEVVDLFVEGRLACANQIVAEVHALTGGESGWTELATWAAKSLPASEKAAIDQMLVGNKTQRQLAIMALQAKHQREFGFEGVMLHGKTPVGDSAYSSMADAVKDMQIRGPDGKELYATDPDFRAKVEKRIARMRR